MSQSNGTAVGPGSININLLLQYFVARSCKMLSTAQQLVWKDANYYYYYYYYKPFIARSKSQPLLVNRRRGNSPMLES